MQSAPLKQESLGLGSVGSPEDFGVGYLRDRPQDTRLQRPVGPKTLDHSHLEDAEVFIREFVTPVVESESSDAHA